MLRKTTGPIRKFCPPNVTLLALRTSEKRPDSLSGGCIESLGTTLQECFHPGGYTYPNGQTLFSLASGCGSRDYGHGKPSTRDGKPGTRDGASGNDGEPEPGTRDQGAPGTGDGRSGHAGTVRLLATTWTVRRLAPVTMTVLCSVRVYTRGY